MSLLDVKQISHTYKTNSMFKPHHERTVLNNISFSIDEGSCFAILGSSGAGKSTIGKIILGIEKPTQGSVQFMGHDLYTIDKKLKHQLRRDLQVVFQDSYSSVNPRMTAEQIIAEPLKNYEKLSATEQKRSIIELLEHVGLSKNDLMKYPHEFSGGQLQRINIARALSLKPKLIVLDEPVSSLDMVNQTLILELLNNLKKELGLTYFFITHDIKAAHMLADQLGILEKGQLVEVFNNPSEFFTSVHPVVHQLRSAILAEHPSSRTIRSNKRP